MDLKVLEKGWHRHLSHFRRIRARLAGGQDPKVFCLSCSDSRVNVHEIFCMNKPGSIFEVKNVGGLFSDDAKAALVYALNHLRPDIIVVMHHTRCGGYRSLADDVEPEIRKHMVMFGGFYAKVRVENYLVDRNLSVSAGDLEQLVLEEGCRLQAESILSFLNFGYPRVYEEVKKGGVRVIPLLYHTVTGRVCVVPKTLEGSEGMKREEL